MILHEPEGRTIKFLSDAFRDAQTAHAAALRSVPKNVRIVPPILVGFFRSRRLKPDSAKTRGNSVRITACRNMDELTGACHGGTYRLFDATSEKRLRLRDNRARDRRTLQS